MTRPSEAVRTYEDDLTAIERHLHDITALVQTVDITPGEAACLRDAERALSECVESLRAG